MANIQEYTEKSNLLDDMTSKDSLVNQFSFTDIQTFDQSFEGVSPVSFFPSGALSYISTSDFTVSSGNTTYLKPRNANFAIIVWRQTDVVMIGRGSFIIARVGATTVVIGMDGPNVNDDWSYTFTWGTTGINVEETTDPGANKSIQGTFYWYR